MGSAHRQRNLFAKEGRYLFGDIQQLEIIKSVAYDGYAKGELGCVGVGAVGRLRG